MIIDPTTVSANVNYRILVSSVVPRPIAFVSTVSPEGVYNLAPFSFFNVVCGDPPVVCFSPIWRNPPKDTIVNIRATGEFVVNIVSEEFADKMNVCAGRVPVERRRVQVVGADAGAERRGAGAARAGVAREHGVPAAADCRGERAAHGRKPRPRRGRPLPRGRCGDQRFQDRCGQTRRSRENERLRLRSHARPVLASPPG